MAPLPLLGAAFALLSTTMSTGADGPDKWVPVRWQGGPLEVQRRFGDAQAAGEIPAIVRNWYDPVTLRFLDETPINCILVTWSTGAPLAQELDHQKQVVSYAAAARARNIRVLGLVYPGADLERAALSGMSAKLDGLVLEEFTNPIESSRRLRTIFRANNSPAIAIAFGTIAQVSRDADSPVSATTEAVAPGIHPISDATTASPTTEPWIDFNFWLARLLKHRNASRPVWLGHRISGDQPTDYARAIADAAVGGARWVVAPGDRLLAGLRREEPAAKAQWREMARYLRFYEQQPEWRSFSPTAVAGIVDDPSDPDPDLAAETLKLIARRRIPYRLIDGSRLDSDSLVGLRAVVALDTAPSQSRNSLLTTFARRGFTAVTLACKERNCPGQFGYEVLRTGAGQIVAYPERPDPEALSKNLLEIIGNDNLPVRLFNVPSVLPEIAAAPGGQTMLVHLVNYATTPAVRITLRVAGSFRKARLLRAGKQPVPLAIQNSRDRVEVLIPDLTVSAAVILEK